MLELLRDGIWQFIGAALTVASILAAAGIYWLQRRTRELAFGLVTHRRLLTVANELSPRVSVQLDGRAVRDLHLLVYGLKNSGHSAVLANDFERPLSISFSDGQVLSAEVASQKPANLAATLEVGASRVELRPLLLNAGDQVLIQVLVSAPTVKDAIDARIVNVARLTPIVTPPTLPPFFQSGSAIVVGGVLVGAAAANILDLPGQPPWWFWVALAALLAVFSLARRLMNTLSPASRRTINEA